MNQYSALYYVSTYEGEDYYLNMDNTYLLTELKGLRDKNKIELTKARFIYSMALIAMSVVGYCKKIKEMIKKILVIKFQRLQRWWHQFLYLC